MLATVGKRGALLVTPGQTLEVPGFPVKAVDTTAAGDTFCAAFCTKLAEGAGMEESIRFANAAAAISVGRAGAQTSIPTLQETLAFLDMRAV